LENHHKRKISKKKNREEVIAVHEIGLFMASSGDTK
jgi:hypothetical protein